MGKYTLTAKSMVLHPHYRSRIVRDKTKYTRTKIMEEDNDPFSNDESWKEPPSWPCPECGELGYLSYFRCDEDPYPFEGILKECGSCNHMWEDEK